jgi:hypothetical protein
MSVSITCECTNTFSLKDEYQGRMVKCPSCGAAVRAATTDFTAAGIRPRVAASARVGGNP